MTYIKVKDKNHLERDQFSKAIVNTDYENYQKYVDNYKQVYTEKQRILKLEADMTSVKDDLLEIKQLLRGLYNESK